MNADAAKTSPSPAVPSGTVTFVFTDIEGSTVRWERYPRAMQGAVRRHDEIVRSAIVAHDGYVFKTLGDAFCAAFARSERAVAATIAAQLALAAEDFADVDGLRIRAAIHTGTTDERGGDYFGPPVNRVARLLAIAHGGQVVLSGVTSTLVRNSLPAYASLRDLGDHQLKDLSRPERVYQLVAAGMPQEFPALPSLGALPNNLPLEVSSFIGREAEIADVTALLQSSRSVSIAAPEASARRGPRRTSGRRCSTVFPTVCGSSSWLRYRAATRSSRRWPKR